MSEPTISFDSTSWQSQGRAAPGTWVWYTPEGDGVGLYEFTKPPDLPTASTLEEFRTLSEQQSGPRVEMAVVEIGDRLLLRQIAKAPQQPSGMTYVGSLTLPFADSSLVLKVQCEERGTTGTREAILMDRLMHEGLLRFSDGRLEGIEKFDDARYDDEFPDHPLSRARRVLAHLERSIVLDPVLRGKPPFPLPRSSVSDR